MVKDVSSYLVLLLEPLMTGDKSWEVLGLSHKGLLGCVQELEIANLEPGGQTQTPGVFCVADTQCLPSEYDGWRQGTYSPAEPLSIGLLPSFTSSACFLKAFEFASPGWAPGSHQRILTGEWHCQFYGFVNFPGSSGTVVVMRTTLEIGRR